MQRRHRDTVESVVLATGKAGVYVCAHTKKDANFTLRNYTMVLSSWEVRWTSCFGE